MNKDFDTTPRSQRRRESQGLLDEGVTDEERKAMDDSALETRFSLASSPGIFEALKFRFGDMRMVSMRKKLVESFRAAAEGNVQALRAFLSEDGGNRDILDERGLAALHYAARYNQHAAVTLLLDFGANIDVRAADGCSPLHQAVRYIRIFPLLLYTSTKPIIFTSYEFVQFCSQRPDIVVSSELYSAKQ